MQFCWIITRMMTKDKVQQVKLGRIAWRSTCQLHCVNYRIEFEFCWIRITNDENKEKLGTASIEGKLV